MIVTEHEERYRSGALMNLYYQKNGINEGPCVHMYESGNPEIVCNFNNGVLVGPYTEFYENGKYRLRGYYLNGMLDGVVTEFDRQENVVLTGTYRNGLLNGELIEYCPHKKGQNKLLIRRKIEYVDGEMYGASKEYWDNGNLMIDCVCQKNKVVGKIYSYFRNGIVSTERNFGTNGLEGMQKTYYPNGKLNHVYTYHKGVLQESIEYKKTGLCQCLKNIFKKKVNNILSR